MNHFISLSPDTTTHLLTIIVPDLLGELKRKDSRMPADQARFWDVWSIASPIRKQKAPVYFKTLTRWLFKI